jgi:hypothetical protein
LLLLADAESFTFFGLAVSRDFRSLDRSAPAGKLREGQMSSSSLSSSGERYLAPLRAAFGVTGLLTVATVPTMGLMEDTTGDSSGDTSKEGDDDEEEDVKDEEKVAWVAGLRGTLRTVAAVPTMGLMEDDDEEEDVKDEERVVWMVDEEREDEERISTGSATATGASSNLSSPSYISTMDGRAAVTFFLGAKKGCSLLLNPSSFRDDTIVM